MIIINKPIKFPIMIVDSDGYVLESSLLELEEFLYSLDNGFIRGNNMFLFLKIVVADAFEKMSYGVMEVLEDDVAANHWRVSLVTGGWSGCEELIDRMLSVPMVKAFYFNAWRRGGYYEFSGPRSNTL